MAHRPAAQIRRFPPGLDVKLSDVLKSYPPPKGDSYVYTDDDVANAAADKKSEKAKGNKIPKRSKKHVVKLPQCPACWSPSPPLCTKCCEVRKMLCA